MVEMPADSNFSQEKKCTYKDKFFRWENIADIQMCSIFVQKKRQKLAQSLLDEYLITTLDPKIKTTNNQ